MLPGTGVEPAAFWQGFDAIVHDLAPKNTALLAERDRLQTELDAWHKANPGPDPRHAGLPRVPARESATWCRCPKDVQVDDAPTSTPNWRCRPARSWWCRSLNARYALNAANARWGSLYDALYGTDVMPEDGGAEQAASGYNPVRGAKVIEYARHVLDRTAPLKKGSHVDADRLPRRRRQAGRHAEGRHAAPAWPSRRSSSATRATRRRRRRCCWRTTACTWTSTSTAATPIGTTDPAGVSDLVLEAALSTILDLEDSVAVVDADDKVLAYGNWLGILKGTLTEEMSQGRQDLHARPEPRPRLHRRRAASDVQLHGRSLLFVRNVGHLMTNPAILYGDGTEIPEGILDAVVTTADRAARPARPRHATASATRRTGSVYIVKPKMHGPAEVAFASELFGRVETLLGLPDNTVKLGIMDEERRTSVNLKACIAAAASRVAFINTGFLDRTGDEMHTAMHAGPMIRKGDMKTSAWIARLREAATCWSAWPAACAARRRSARACGPCPT